MNIVDRIAAIYGIVYCVIACVSYVAWKRESGRYDP